MQGFTSPFLYNKGHMYSQIHIEQTHIIGVFTVRACSSALLDVTILTTRMIFGGYAMFALFAVTASGAASHC